MSPTRFIAPHRGALIPTLLAALGSTLAGQQVADVAARQFDLRETNFIGVNLRGANLSDRDLSGSLFQRADVTGAHFWRTRLDGADLRGVVGLTGAQLTAAVWDPDRAPRVDDGLNLLRRLWERRRGEGQDLRGTNWWNRDLSGFKFADADLRGAVFIDANLADASLIRVKLADAVLAGADLSGADLRGVSGLTAGQLVSARWSPQRPPRVEDALNLLIKLWQTRRLAGQDLRGARLWLADLQGVDLTGANLSRSALLGADLRGARLRDADLDLAVLTAADLSGADLRGARGLTTAMLVSARWDPKRPPSLDLDATLTRALVDRRNLQQLDLAGANFWGRDLRDVSLEGAKLNGCVFNAADLTGANLVDADLTLASLTGADLSGADLRNAIGLTAGQLLSAHWADDKPPRLNRDLELVRKQFGRLDLKGQALHDACLWDRVLTGARFVGVSLRGVAFVRTDLRDASFLRSDLTGVSLLGADISGADFRGARNLPPQAIIAAIWDLARPPSMDPPLNLVREQIENRRIEFDLQGAQLQAIDPRGIMGPLRATDRIAGWRLGTPPRLGLPRLIDLLRAGDYGQLRVSR